MKVRIEKAILERARACADDIGEPLTEWARRAMIQYRKGTFGSVAVLETAKVATRAGSTVATLPGDRSEADEMREAICAAVEYCEAKMRARPRFRTNLVEGVDYVVKSESSGE